MNKWGEKCRWCDESSIYFEPNPLVAKELKGDEVPDEVTGIAYCPYHYRIFHPSRVRGMHAAVDYLKKKGKMGKKNYGTVR